MRASLLLSVLPLLSLLVPIAACSTPFDPPSLVESVRVFAIRADKPYAAPGDTVNLEMLAFDGRPPTVPPAAPAAPMRLFWAPVACPDPIGDAYFGCYPGFDALLTPGVDLTSKLVEGTKFSFQVPADVLVKHKSSPAYGVVVVFAMACAGHVEFVARGGDTIPPPPPLGCFGADGVELGPDDSVFAYAQVFSFADGRTNANPVLDHLTFAGAAVDPAKGVTLTHCTETNSAKCPTTDLDTVVPSASWEVNPSDLDATTGKPLHEEIWVDYYTNARTGGGGSTLLYDAHLGKLASSSIKVQAPATVAAGEQTLWAVVRDNRGGVSWTQVPVHVN